jgi:hypothetical protein
MEPACLLAAHLFLCVICTAAQCIFSLSDMPSIHYLFAEIASRATLEHQKRPWLKQILSTLISEAGGVSDEGSPRSESAAHPWLTPGSPCSPRRSPSSRELRAARLTRQNRTGNEAQVSLSPTVRAIGARWRGRTDYIIAINIDRNCEHFKQMRGNTNHETTGFRQGFCAGSQLWPNGLLHTLGLT